MLKANTAITNAQADLTNVIALAAFGFQGCTNLTSVYVPTTVVEIGEQVFDVCTNLESLTLPFVGKKQYASQDDANEDGREGLTATMSYWFGHTSATNGMTKLRVDWSGNSDYDFYDYPTNLNTITILEGCKIMFAASFACERNGGNIDGRTYSVNNITTTITLPSSIEYIGEQAFCALLSLKKINIPQNVNFIDYGAFSYCNSLEYIKVNNPQPFTMRQSFHDTNCPIYVPTGSVATYKAASGWSDYADRIFAIGS